MRNLIFEDVFNSSWVESIANLSNKKVQQHFFDLLYIKCSKKQAKEIAEQGLLVCLSLRGITPDYIYIENQKILKTHYYAMLAVLISHIIDDVADYLPLINLKMSRELGLLFYKSNVSKFYDKNFYKFVLQYLFKAFQKGKISKVHNSIADNIQWQPLVKLVDEFEKYLDSERLNLYYYSMTRMILAGLIQSVGKWSENNKFEIQKNLIHKYKSMTIKRLHSKYMKDLVKKAPAEILISTASSLQEMFNVFDTNKISYDFLESLNFLMGVLIFEHNSKEEREIRGYEFFQGFDKANKTSMYKKTLKLSAKFVFRKIKNNNYKIYYYRLLQLYMIYRYMSGVDFFHKFENLEDGLDNEIKVLYDGIVHKLLKLKYFNTKFEFIYKLTS